MSTHYETLGIRKDASAKQVKASYRSLVKLFHPDRFAAGSKAHAEAEKRIRESNAAYAVLSKPVSRASYDLKLNQALPHSGVEPEHCGNCGKATTYGTRLEKWCCATYAREQIVKRWREGIKVKRRPVEWGVGMPPSV